MNKFLVSAMLIALTSGCRASGAPSPNPTPSNTTLVLNTDCTRTGATSSGKVFQVGPTRTYQTLDAVQSALAPGDRVEVDGDATYPSVALSVQGTAAAPIVFAGVPVNGKLPVVSGGDNTVHFNGSHHVVLQGFDITAGDRRCVFHHADDITLCQSVVHDCPRHGILGADTDSGSLLLDRVEVHHTGGLPPGESYQHPVYVATDPAAFPAAVFRMQNSFIHDNNGGNCVKSRALRTELYDNWIENSTAPDSYYTLELIGFQEFQSVNVNDWPRQDSDVVGNVLVHRRPGLGMRFGGDGSGDSRGRVRFVNNTVIFFSGFGQYDDVLRFTDRIESFEADNNVFFHAGGSAFRLTRDDDAVWVRGNQTITGKNNWIPSGSSFVPTTLTGSVSAADGPGFVAATNVDALDLNVPPGASIFRAGVALDSGASGFEIANPLVSLNLEPPATRPTGLSELIARPRAAEPTPTLGARAGLQPAIKTLHLRSGDSLHE